MKDNLQKLIEMLTVFGMESFYTVEATKYSVRLQGKFTAELHSQVINSGFKLTGSSPHVTSDNSIKQILTFSRDKVNIVLVRAVEVPELSIPQPAEV